MLNLQIPLLPLARTPQKTKNELIWKFSS